MFFYIANDNHHIYFPGCMNLEKVLYKSTFIYRYVEGILWEKK